MTERTSRRWAEKDRTAAQANLVRFLREAAQSLEDAPTLANRWHLEELAVDVGKIRAKIHMATT